MLPRFAISFLLLVLVTSNATAVSCSGNACDDIVMSDANGCTTITNYGTKRVIIKYSGYTLELQRGESKRLMNPFAPTQCNKIFMGNMVATYVSGSAP
jgi:hypothetical protein